MTKLMHKHKSDADFVTDVAKRLMHVPVSYGLNGFDIDCLADLSSRLRAAEQNSAVLDKPARVGSAVFRKGVAVEAVILAAQRAYEHAEASESLREVVARNPDDFAEHYVQPATMDDVLREQAAVNVLRPARYEARENVVHKLPVKTLGEGGTWFEVGFPVCTASEYVAASTIAAILDEYERAAEKPAVEFVELKTPAQKQQRQALDVPAPERNVRVPVDFDRAALNIWQNLGFANDRLNQVPVLADELRRLSASILDARAAATTEDSTDG